MHAKATSDRVPGATLPMLSRFPTAGRSEGFTDCFVTAMGVLLRIPAPTASGGCGSFVNAQSSHATSLDNDAQPPRFRFGVTLKQLPTATAPLTFCGACGTVWLYVVNHTTFGTPTVGNEG